MPVSRFGIAILFAAAAALAFGPQAAFPRKASASEKSKADKASGLLNAAGLRGAEVVGKHSLAPSWTLVFFQDKDGLDSGFLTRDPLGAVRVHRCDPPLKPAAKPARLIRRPCKAPILILRGEDGGSGGTFEDARIFLPEGKGWREIGAVPLSASARAEGPEALCGADRPVCKREVKLVYQGGEMVLSGTETRLEYLGLARGAARYLKTRVSISERYAVKNGQLVRLSKRASALEHAEISIAIELP